MTDLPQKNDSIYALLGKTLVLFEDMLDTAKSLAGAVIRAKGLNDREMAESLVGHLNAEETRRTLTTLLGIYYADIKYMRSVSRHILRRFETANKLRNNLVHSLHLVDSSETKSSTFRLSRVEGYHNQIHVVFSDQQLSELCDELFELKILLMRVRFLVETPWVNPYGSFGIRNKRKLYARMIIGPTNMFPDVKT